ncbi:MAG: acyl carrier protein [Lachnospiraceae bacterium]|nr:acyl carrier protein [Lachnospiraceae bacterium]
MELEKLKSIIAEVAGVHTEEITLGTTFMDDLGVDSLDVYQIIMGIEQEFNIEITPEQAETVKTIEDAVNLIKDVIG